MKKPGRWLERLLVAPNTKGNRNKSVLRLMAPSVLSLLLCAVCLAGLTWAWFSVSEACSASPVQTSTFTVRVDVEDASGTAISESENGGYPLGAGTYTVTLTAAGTASTGYCTVEVGDTKYHTEQMIPGGDPFVFTIDRTNAADAATLTVTPSWGTYRGENETLLGASQGIDQSSPAEETQPEEPTETSPMESTEAPTQEPTEASQPEPTEASPTEP